MYIDLQGSQKMHVRVAISQNELVKNFQNSYLNHHDDSKLYTLQSVKVVIAPRLEAPPGTMCYAHAARARFFQHTEPM